MKLILEIGYNFDRLIDTETKLTIGQIHFKTNNKNYFSRKNNFLCKKRVLGINSDFIRYFL